MLLGPAHVTNLLQKKNSDRVTNVLRKKTAFVSEPQAMHVLVWLGVHGDGLFLFFFFFLKQESYKG